MSLIDRDKKHIWHPLTQHKTYPNPLAISRAKGIYLYDENGKAYIDAISSWYTCVYGHCNPYITERVSAQMHKLDQIIFSGLTHEAAVVFSEKLIEIAPKGQNKIFFSDNGSTAVEVGVKMALQYHFNRGYTKLKLVAFEEGFHGDTFGAMSVSDLSVYHGAFEKLFISVERIPVPTGENNAAVYSKMKDIISKGEVAGFIYEPLVQGAAGMKFINPEGLDTLLELCKNNNVLAIADEVMTGFGKTAHYFASDALTYKPDIVCLSKALTAGLIPMGATTCTDMVFEAFYDNSIGKALFHAHTYSANPLCCACASASIDLLTSDDIQNNIKAIEKAHKNFVKHISDHPKVCKTRHSGVILAFDLTITMERYGNLRQKIYNYFIDKGVFLRPLGNTIYILPPYVTTEKELQNIYKTIQQFLDTLD